MVRAKFSCALTPRIYLCKKLWQRLLISFLFHYLSKHHIITTDEYVSDSLTRLLEGYDSPYIAVITALLSGLAAGVMSACLSQPADTVLSNISKAEGKVGFSQALRDIISSSGPYGLFRGLASRVHWSGAIISGQFGIYQQLKSLFHVTSDDLSLSLDIISSIGTQ